MSEEEREEAEKRAHHNALERKRRDHIKDSFLSLREAVPSLKGEKASRAQILKKTAEYIQFMNKKNEDHRSAIENLTRLNNILEKQISILEKTQGAGNFAVESGENSNAGNAYNSDNSDYEQTTTPTMKSKRKKKFDNIL